MNLSEAEYIATFPSLSEAPGKLLITEPDANFPTQSKVFLKGTCDSRVVLEIQGEIQGGSLVLPCVEGSFLREIDLTGADGVKNIIISQKDTLGNSLADSRTFIKDSTPPAIQMLIPMDSQLVNSSLPISGTCETGSLDVQIELMSLRQGAPCIAGTYSTNLNVGSLPEGELLLKISQTDKVGLRTEVQRKILKDSIAPSLSIASPTNLSEVTPPVEVKGTCESGLMISFSGAGIASSQAVNCQNSSFTTILNLSNGAGFWSSIASEHEL